MQDILYKYDVDTQNLHTYTEDSFKMTERGERYLIHLLKIFEMIIFQLTFQWGSHFVFQYT